MDATLADGLWVRDLLTTAGPFVPLVLAALLLVLDYLVLEPTSLRHVLLATGPARSDVAEFGAYISSVRAVCLAPRGQSAAKCQHVGTIGAPCPSPGNGDSKSSAHPARHRLDTPGSDRQLTGNVFRRVDDRCGSSHVEQPNALPATKESANQASLGCLTLTRPPSCADRRPRSAALCEPTDFASGTGQIVDGSHPSITENYHPETIRVDGAKMWR